ncbi:hypothetical protein Ciccas_004453 [Cichlidogyrus casuarinus]|uniref:BROMI C-terminal Rab TBC-like domain-containing protein n=1 Tax=Cichlidogyrus casuarinus TaxID=1844966 RepID=A0ABD2QBG4_9PLAT
MMLNLRDEWKIDKMLLAHQQNSLNEENKVIICALSVERNHLLSRMLTIGGPSERILAPKSICQVHDSPYPFPLIMDMENVDFYYKKQAVHFCSCFQVDRQSAKKFSLLPLHKKLMSAPEFNKKLSQLHSPDFSKGSIIGEKQEGYCWEFWRNKQRSKSHRSVSLREDLCPLLMGSCHMVEVLLAKELPEVYNTLLMAEIPPCTIAYNWMSQCYLNYLDFDQIVDYLALLFSLGAQFQVFFPILIFHNLKDRLLLALREKKLLAFLKENPIEDFSMKEMLSMLEELRRNYSSPINDFFKNITN